MIPLQIINPLVIPQTDPACFSPGMLLIYH